jgi:catechol 2,3-dioxygenase-like lactoylglutathione lyase family enzyme
MVIGFDHVHIHCGDLEKSVKYFQDLFGGREVSRGELQGFPLVRMEVNGMTVALRGVDPKANHFEAGTGKRGLDHFGFKVDDMEKTLRELRQKGAEIIGEPKVSPLGLKYAFIDGPEGIKIELIEKP